MSITEREIDQAYSDLKPTHGGVRQDYFGLLYLEREFRLDRDHAAAQIAFGGNDFGLDGFHFDEDRRILYLFQFKWSNSPVQFKGSFERLIQSGMDLIFGDGTMVQDSNQMLLQLHHCLVHNQNLIEKVCFQFVFNGDTEEAERSQVLDKLREDLEAKKFLMDSRLGRQVTMVFEFRSARSKRLSGMLHTRITHSYPIQITETLKRSGPNGEQMDVGFVQLMALHSMYRDMGQRFFERNIRAGLEASEAPNRAIEKALRNIVLNGQADPAAFAFDHNGVTIAAECVERMDGHARIIEPRLLNGAQTITTVDRFIKANEGNPKLKERREALDSLHVLCKIVTKAKPEFVTTVTINNNRQNPVLPWNLRANDMIQLSLQDKFRQDLGIYYERQENAFQNLTDQDLEELEITEHKAIELVRLAQTFLVADGEIDKLSRMREVFESDTIYGQVFSESRLRADSRKIILCYKVQFRVRRVIMEIIEKGTRKYAYLGRARNLVWALLCQAMLNDEDCEGRTERFGQTMTLESDYTDWLRTLASTRVRFLIGTVAEEKYADKIANGQFDFLRSKAVYDKCMEQAYKKWKWVQKKLR